MAGGTLYSVPGNFRTLKVLIAANYSNADVKLAKNFIFGESNKHHEFLKKFPLGKVPALETNNGQLLTESNAIAFYVASEQLRGKNELQQAQILQWLSFADSEIWPVSCALVYPSLGILQPSKQTSERSKEEIKAILSYLDAYLLTRTYLVGERVTLADISVALTLLQLYQHILEPSIRDQYVNVNRWFATIINQPEVKKELGEVSLCQKALEFDPKKFAEYQAALKKAGIAAPGASAKETPPKGKGEGKKDKAKGSQGQDEGKTKEKAGGGEEQKKKKESKKKEEDAEEMDETEQILASEPKAKDPFEEYPKGTFDFDEFKRCYSNNEETVSIPFFWEKIDKQNYSIWFCEYKYRDELTKVFMSCNLISGMYQRLEKLRKNAFASVCLFGEDNNSSISGVWIWRTHELVFKLSPDWQIDYESYEWTKLDADDAKTKDLVKQYLSWSGTDKDGRKFNQGKIFK